VEAETKFVTVYFSPNIGGDVGSGWDTHGNNFNCLKDRLLPEFDRPFAALLEDLHDRGLLEETLVLVSSEMGRKPRIGDPRSGGVNGAVEQFRHEGKICFMGRQRKQNLSAAPSHSEARCKSVIPARSVFVNALAVSSRCRVRPDRWPRYSTRPQGLACLAAGLSALAPSSMPAFIV
jgi:hypothetical protein